MSERPEPPRIPFQRPTLPSAAKIERYFEISRERRWFTNGGPCWHLLRERLADRVGAYCTPVANGTLGLMVALAAVIDASRGTAGRGRGALMPSFTFPATAQAALWRGLEPRLIDIDAGHWHMDASLLARVIRDGRNDLRVVLAVSAFGTPPPAETRIHWEQLCRAAGIPLVVDSAAGFGAVADDGTPIGAQGDLEVVSFHATKPFAVGEGGAVFTRARRLHERVELAANFGLRADRSLGLAMGLNAKMSEVHAATALAVLDELDVILEQRRRAADQVRAQAGSNVAWQVGCERSTWQFVPVAFLDPDRRAQAVASCDAGVEVRTYYEPLHKMAAFEHWPVVDRGLPMTRDLHERLLCLPMANDMDDRELDLIAGVARSGLPTAIQSSPSATG